MLCDRSGSTKVIMRCHLEPQHNLQGHLCDKDAESVFINQTVDARCLQCFPDEASIARENAAHPAGRLYISFGKVPT